MILIYPLILCDKITVESNSKNSNKPKPLMVRLKVNHCYQLQFSLHTFRESIAFIQTFLPKPYKFHKQTITSVHMCSCIFHCRTNKFVILCINGGLTASLSASTLTDNCPFTLKDKRLGSDPRYFKCRSFETDN